MAIRDVYFLCYDMAVTDRYSRQTLYRNIGTEGQEKLGRSRVLLVGCGALGSVAAEILVRGGVGKLTIADRDYIEESNLQRQALFTEADAREGLPKAVAAARHLAQINNSVSVVAQVVDVNSRTIESLVDNQDLIVDGTDNFEARYLLNDASVKWNLPWVYGACVGAYGLCLAMIPGQTPCLRCLLGQLPAPGSAPTCDTVGVIGPIVHLVAAMESAEALKILTGHADQVNRKLTGVDLWENQVMTMDLTGVERMSGCPTCVERRFEFLDGEHETQTQTLCGRNSVQISRSEPRPLDFGPIAKRLAAVGSVKCNDYLLRANVEGFEIAVFRDGRSIVHGTRDADEARRVYAKFIGN